MNEGFEVFVTKDIFTRKLIVKDREIRIGKVYTNNVALDVDFDSFKLLELDQNCLRLYPNNRFEIILKKDGFEKKLSEIISFVEVRNFIEIKKDIRIIVRVGDYELFIVPVVIEESHISYVPDKFKESIIVRENIGFLSLLMLISILAFYFMEILIIKAPKNLYIQLPTKDEKVYEISYKKATENIIGHKKSSRGELTSIKEKNMSGNLESFTVKKEAGGFFEGDSMIGKGVLSVEKSGAKNVLIEREKSLFSKLDENLKSKPIKGYEDVTNFSGKTFTTPRKYETAKLGDISDGDLIKNTKEKKIELQGPEKLRTGFETNKVQVLKGKRLESEIISVISRHKKGLEFLYIEERKKDSSLQGRLVIKINISGKGFVDEVEVIDTDIENKDFIQKIVFLLKSIKFSEGDFGDTTVKIPLVFLPS